jgi:hypothetical protein
MTMAYEVSACSRGRMAGVISIDGACRPQFVPDDDPGEFAALLREARARWGVGAVLNTSFNIHGEPLVCSPAEAIDVFRRSGADALAIGPFLILRPADEDAAGRVLQGDTDPLAMSDRPARVLAAIGRLTAAWLAALAAVLVWVLRTPEVWLREELKILQFWSLEICVVLGIGLAAVLAREVLRGLGRQDVARLLLLTLVAVVLTAYVAPRTNRIYYDEQIYQGIGQNLSDMKRAQMCNDGTVEYGQLQCWSGQYNKQPYAYPHALSLAYRLFGVHEVTAFRVNVAVMAATVCVVYLLVWLLFEDVLAAFFAALLVALTPEQLMWSATAAAAPASSLAAVAALAAAAHFVRSRSPAALAGAAVAAYAVQFRPESLLIVPSSCCSSGRAHATSSRVHGCGGQASCSSR